jgi:hypothetical protein
MMSTDVELQTLLTGFPQARQLEQLRRNLDAQGSTQSAGGEREWGTWQQNWDTRIKPLVGGDFQPAANRQMQSARPSSE